MDSYFPKTRRPHTIQPGSLKRPPPSITPPKAAKIPSTPTTPKDARLTRPLQPPPVKSKRQCQQERRRPTSVKELFKTVRPLDDSPITEQTPLPTTTKATEKIASGPLKGLSTSLLDLIRAKEAAASTITPEQVRRRELLGIAPEIVRIVPTVFTANKREVMLYDKVIDKCFKGLKSNYTSATIMECLDLMDKVAPDWISTVDISRGKFMRINRTKYTIPQLLQAIRNFQKN